MQHEKQSQAPPAYSPPQTHGYGYGPQPGQSSSAEAAAPTVRVHGPMFRGPDIEYLKTPCGIAKIVQAVSEILSDLLLYFYRAAVCRAVLPIAEVSVCLSVRLSQREL